MSLLASASPLLSIPNAVATPAESPDAGVAWHYGDPLGEQRAAENHSAIIDRSHRTVLTITGSERLSWLHTISSQHVAELADNHSAENLDLDLNGRVQHHFVLTEQAGTLWLDTEGSRGAALGKFLTSMVFWADAQPQFAPNYAVLSLLGPRTELLAEPLGLPALPDEVYAAAPLPEGGFIRRMPGPTTHAFDLIIPRDQLVSRFERLTAAGAQPAGSWAYSALRVAALTPRIGLDTDERTIPHEVHWIGSVAEHGAVHLNKGCYRGQETVARVHNLGKPPRRLVLLHLDGSVAERPEPGEPLTVAGRTVGRLGTVADHYELGPIALALVKRNIPAETTLVAGPTTAAIDPDSIVEDTTPQAGRIAIDRLRQG